MEGITEMTNWSVDLIDVRKTYAGSIHALRGVNVQVKRGEIFGLLGPNGAGKTTLVKIMTTVIWPTHALGTILGRPIGHRGKLATIGYLPEDHRFPPYLTGRQVLDYYAALAKVPKARRKESASRLLSLLSLSEWANTRVDRYSKGMLQRLGVAQALMNDPELIILDEPTDGLDPVGRRDVRRLLLSLKAEGKTIFLNSHLLSELEMICDRVSILVDGLVARQGTLSELTEHTVEYRIAFAGNVTAIQSRIEALGGSVTAGMVTLPGHDSQRTNAVVDLLRSNEVLVESVEPHRFSLEDVLMEAVGNQRIVLPARNPAADSPGR
ncbi:MAG: ABC transporter ATP-binding protein [Planctomycetes bacterium]|nr:ABC transporter ATP-binding protein [Planctomycetota bacterium]